MYKCHILLKQIYSIHVMLVFIHFLNTMNNRNAVKFKIYARIISKKYITDTDLLE